MSPSSSISSSSKEVTDLNQAQIEQNPRICDAFNLGGYAFNLRGYTYVQSKRIYVQSKRVYAFNLRGYMRSI